MPFKIRMRSTSFSRHLVGFKMMGAYFSRSMSGFSASAVAALTTSNKAAPSGSLRILRGFHARASVINP